MSVLPFHVDDCRGHVHYVSTSEVTIEGQIAGRFATGTSLSYVASAPPDFRASYSGSGLPFTSPAMALENTPNKGEVAIASNGSFSFKIQMPNSYYAAHGTVLIPPTVYVTYTLSTGKQHTVAIKIEEPIPYRTLTYPNGRTSASFYDVQLPVRSQEQILRDSAYPISSTLMPENHWGLKPPM